MKITIREKLLKTGDISLYLDIYNKGKREYEFLDLRIVSESNIRKLDKSLRTEIRDRNKDIYIIANKIKSKREYDIIAMNNNLPNRNKLNLSIYDLIDKIIDSKDKSNTSKNYLYVKKSLIKFTSKEFLPFKEITNEFNLKYQKYLNDNYKPNSSNIMYIGFITIMNEAKKQGFIINFQFDKILKTEKTHRDFLTINELNLFLNADTKYNEYKNAFLFSCFTGLRISDLSKLTFNDIVNNEIIIRQTKTNEPLRIPLPNDMIDFINSKREKNNIKIFDLPNDLTNINKYIKQIAKQVGITKNISFHTSRHTFAVLLLSQGIDIYTVSKLLGHTDIKTTQIYADIVSESKLNAIEKINNLNFIKLLNK